MIIDPNRADNNISGGSSEARRILNLYSKTYDLLHQKLEQFSEKKIDLSNFSFLDELLGGNFTAYREQRAALLTAYQRTMAHVHRAPSPPPPPPPPPVRPFASSALPPPPPPVQPAPPIQGKTVSATQTPSEGSPNGSKQDGSTTPNPSVKRLQRLRSLRPDLEPVLQGMASISKNQAVKTAGFETWAELVQDLATREEALRHKQSEEGKTKKKKATK